MTAKETAAVDIIVAVGQAIRELKSVPSGYLYAQLMSHMSLETFNKIVTILKNSGAVKEDNHLLSWVGQ